MAIVSIASLKAKWITGYIPTQADYVDLFDTLSNLSTILGANQRVGGQGITSDDTQSVLLLQDGQVILSFGNNSIVMNAGGVIITSNVGISLVAPGIPKVYKILSSQSGVDAPTIIELINTEGVVTVGYVSPGLYRLNALDENFTAEKTFMSIQGGSLSDDVTMSITRLSDAMIEVRTYVSGVPSDDVLNNTGILIEVYP